MNIYSTLRWRSVRARALARDGNSCTCSRLLGGKCSLGEPFHVHHVHPVRDGGAPYDLDNCATSCAAHHSMWEPLRRLLVKSMVEPDEAPRCHHQHRTAEARRLCERRMARDRGLARSA